MRKFYMVILIVVVFIFVGCTRDVASNEGLTITSIQSSIGGVGEDSKYVGTQSFKYSIQLTNNERQDLKVISIEPILTGDFAKLVLSKDLVVDVNNIISIGKSLDISGEIIFNAKGLSKEEIISMQPFVKEIKIIEEERIQKSF